MLQDYKFCHARESWFPILCHNSSDTICYKNNNFEFPKGFPTFWAKKKNYYSLSLFTCHYSPVTIHRYFSPLLFTPKFCLFKGACPLYLRQVFFIKEWLCRLPGWSYSFAFTCIILLALYYYHCITMLPLPTPCPFPPLWYQSHSFLAGDSVVVFSVSPSVSTRNFGAQLLCPLLIVVGVTLVVKWIPRTEL